MVVVVGRRKRRRKKGVLGRGLSDKTSFLVLNTNKPKPKKKKTKAPLFAGAGNFAMAEPMRTDDVCPISDSPHVMSSLKEGGGSACVLCGFIPEGFDACAALAALLS